MVAAESLDWTSYRRTILVGRLGKGADMATLSADLSVYK